MYMKYIVSDHLGYEAPFIFPSEISHQNFAMMFMNIDHNRLISAGRVIIDSENDIVCYDQSLTLKLKSRPEIDAALIMKMLNSET